MAHRLRAEIDDGRRPGDVVVLVRATGSLRLLEQALEEQGLPTYVVGGRGYWSQEQVRDGIAYLRALANPRDEEALLAVLSSPFCGVGTDALVLLTGAGRESGLWPALRDAEGSDWIAVLPEAERERLALFARVFATERPRAERVAVEVLLETAIVATGYDLAVLARSGGERRLANLRKLMRLARDYERAEGRDLRGFLDLRRDPGPDRGSRGRGRARVRGARRRAPDDDPPRQGPRVPGRLRGRPRPRRRRDPRAAARRHGRARGAADGADRRRGDRARARLAAPARRGAGGRGRGGAAPVLRRDDASARAADPLRRHRLRALARPAPRRPADQLDRPGAARRPRRRPDGI